MGVAAEAAEKKVAFVKCAGDCTKAHTKGAYVGIKTCTAAAALPGKGDKVCQQGCLGLGECVSVCEFDAIHIVNGIAKVDRNKCVACGRCAKICPQHLIEIIPDKAEYAVECANTEKGKLVKEQCDTGWSAASAQRCANPTRFMSRTTLLISIMRNVSAAAPVPPSARPRSSPCGSSKKRREKNPPACAGGFFSSVFISSQPALRRGGRTSSCVRRQGRS